MKQRPPRAAKPTTPSKAELLARIATLEKRLGAATRTLARKDGEARTLAHELAETRDQQTATSEILRVISSSPTDVRPVFETIVDSAGRLCGAESAVVYRFADDLAHFVASYNFTPETVESYRRRFPRRLRETDHLWRIADGSVLNLADIEQDTEMSTTVAEIYRGRGVREVNNMFHNIRGGQWRGGGTR